MMFKNKSHFVLCFLILLFFATYHFQHTNAQVGHGGQPYSFSNDYVKKHIATETMQSLDFEAIETEDALNDDKGNAFRFGMEMEVNLNLQNAGTWETLEDGSRLWRLKIYSKKAKSINLVYEHFYMPAGARFYLYNEEKTELLGAFTEANNKEYLKFSTGFIKGETTVLEYHEPANVAEQGIIHINKVVHGYRGLFDKAKGYGDSGSCNNNVNCPESAGWENEINSVAMIVVGGFRSCTGAMINNVNDDCTPYFLTANHCLGGNYNTWMFMFNYQSPTCVNEDGPTNMTVSGATLKASASASDFALFELSVLPPPDYNVYLAGFSAETQAAPSCTGIHHPAGDIKKITFNEDELLSSTWGEADDTHWEITEWEDGTTEPGSSGSPLFDNHHRIIGQLHGGTASCSSITEDVYGKVAYSWEAGTSADARLKDWLDPNNTGILVMNGRNCSEAPDILDAGLAQILNLPENLTCETDFTPEIMIRNYGAELLTSLIINYQWNGGSLETIFWEGELEYLESVWLSLPEITLDAGINDLEVTIAFVNGGTDENDVNNLNVATFEVINGTEFLVELNTDSYADETSFEITDSQGNIVVSEGSFGNQNTYDFSYCLPPACYTFTIFDSYGDGLESSGFTVFDDAENILAFGGQGNFGFSEDTDFCLIVPENVINASLANIISPINNNNYCTTDITAAIEITNLGGITLNSFTLNYEFDNNTSQTYDWTGQLQFLNSTIIELPTEILDLGLHNFTVTIVNPNGETDIDMSNNSAEAAFAIAAGHFITVEINTDEYPEETSFALFDDNGNMLAEENAFLNSANHSFSYCLGDGCYNFIMFDEYGDGIFSTDSYNVYNEVGQSLITPNTDMFSVSEHEICLQSSDAFIAAFDSDFNQLCESGVVNFEAITPNATSFSWIFEGGNPSTSTEMNPTVDYPNIGNYNVTLVVGNGSEQNEVMIENYVQVTNNMALLNVDITNASDEIATDGSVYIDITSGNPPFIYQWSTGETTTDNSTLANLAIGNYSVEIIDESNCSLLIDFEIETGTSIETNILSNIISIFPNPTKEKLHISFDESLQNASYKIDILNVAGQILETKTTTANTFFKVENLSSGIYFLRFSDEKNSYITKFVKE
ncbi:MAG: T9SS type A sorting domain-containing protein [Chitinophagales bacterium]